MVLLSIVIPIGPYHQILAHDAIASCQQQILPVQVIPVYDHDRRGAGWARNRGLEQVTTDFVTFLDADDLLEPTWSLHTLRAYDGQHYVYTDWLQNNEPARAPDRPWVNSTWHVVTTLLPTTWARHVGGFDEDLTGGEDTDFYLKLRYAGLCGKRLAEPLMHYRRGGQRSQQFVNTPAEHAFQNLLTKRYGEKAMTQCCGDYNPEELPPVNDQQPGYELAVTLWGGNARKVGASGTLYPRAGNGAKMWVLSTDIDAVPHLWARAVATPKPPTAELSDFQTLAAQLLGTGMKPPPPPPVPVHNPLDTPIQPDVFRLRELYLKARPDV